MIEVIKAMNKTDLIGHINKSKVNKPLTDEQRNEIKEFLRQGKLTQQAIADLVEVSIYSVGKIKKQLMGVKKYRDRTKPYAK